MSGEKQPLKICIVGTHGCGKSTLAYALAAHMKSQGYNVACVMETARSCPFGINEKFSRKSVEWIVASHIKAELDCEARGYEVIISDRSPYDTILYADCLLHEPLNDLHHIITLAIEWMRSYSVIVWVSDILDEIQPDGRRSTDPSFRTKIHDLFNRSFGEDTLLPICRVTQEEIFMGISDVCVDIDTFRSTRSLP